MINISNFKCYLYKIIYILMNYKIKMSLSYTYYTRLFCFIFNIFQIKCIYIFLKFPNLVFLNLIYFLYHIISVFIIFSCWKKGHMFLRPVGTGYESLSWMLRKVTKGQTKNDDDIHVYLWEQVWSSMSLRTLTCSNHVPI